MEKEKLYTYAWQKFGAVSQCVVTMEECAELTKELSKAIRGEANGLKIAEEVADVEIMLEQVKQNFAIQTLVTGFKRDKIKRLEKRLINSRKQVANDNNN